MTSTTDGAVLRSPGRCGERPRRWVVNASPLIVLAKIERLDLLATLSEDFVIPAGVAEEVEAGPREDLASRWLRGGGREKVVPAPTLDPLVAGWDLGLGESQVLAWAHRRPGWEAVVDDGAARRCCSALEIPVRGTVGVVPLARRAGVLPAVRPVLHRMLECGFRIDSTVLAAALRLAGEAGSL